MLKAILGRGGFGEVRECINKENKQHRAVKIIKKIRMDEKEQNSMNNEI